METLTLVLPAQVGQRLRAEAKRKNVDATALCSGLIADHFLGNSEETSSPIVELVNNSAPTSAFDVRKHFPSFPRLSVELAQRFVDEALKLPETRAFKSFSGRGVGISPNFVFVPYLLRRPPGGIGVSFYGSPDKLNHTGLRQGRNPNYSRMTVHSHEQLEPLLRVIRRSDELKLGRIR